MKKRPLIIVCLIVALGALALFFLNEHAKRQAVIREELMTILGDVALSSQKLEGWWSVAGTGKPLPQVSENRIKELSKLTTLPYLQGSRTAPAAANVTAYDTTLAFAGINLYSSGHAQEAIAIDMEGSILHKWRFDINDLWPEVPHTVHSTFWRRVHWYPNGDILAIYEGIGMIKLDKDSRLLWSYKGNCHHQAFVADDDKIYVLTRSPQIVPEIHPEKKVLVDAITELSSNGTVIKTWSIFDCFKKSRFKHLLENMREEGDIFHTNSIYVFDGRKRSYFPFFKKGNVLISILKLDILAIIDLGQEMVVWGESGRKNRMWKEQHDPTLLPSGHILLFDNYGHNQQSKVLDYNAKRRKAVWQYAGDEDHPLFSRTCGTAQGLPNGNVLITESDNGRAIEVTREKKVVWEFINPHRSGEHDELIATLFELIRVDKEYLSWLNATR